MKIAFLYHAEAYHCYHAAPVAASLARIPGCEVTELINFRNILPHLERLHGLLGSPDVPRIQMAHSLKTRFLEKLRHLDEQRERVLRENIPLLNSFDAIVATEYTAGLLKELGVTHPRLILLMHGAGDRLVEDEELVRHFDYVLTPGPKIEAYFQKRGLLKEGQTHQIGYPKFDLHHILRQQPSGSLSSPFALYAPHYLRSLGDWKGCLPHVVEGFRQQNALDLIVAPHIKLFEEDRGKKARRLKKLAGGNIHVDTGSPAMLDMTYTSRAALYIGDVSSQVYEYLLTPRPCVFLNPHRLVWQNDPAFLHWTMGDVVEEPRQLMEAVRQAPKRHAFYLERQKELLQATFGCLPWHGAGQRGAEAIWAFLHMKR